MIVLENNHQCLVKKKKKKETQPDIVCLLNEGHNSSEFRYATFWTHSPTLSLIPVDFTLASTFSAVLEERFLLL